MDDLMPVFVWQAPNVFLYDISKKQHNLYWMYNAMETGKLWQTLVLLIVFLILLMTSAIAMSTEADEAKDEPLSGADILQSVTNGERGFEEPLIALVPEDDYSSNVLLVTNVG